MWFSREDSGMELESRLLRICKLRYARTHVEGKGRPPGITDI